jgi:hypothetical protein
MGMADNDARNGGFKGGESGTREANRGWLLLGRTWLCPASTSRDETRGPAPHGLASKKASMAACRKTTAIKQCLGRGLGSRNSRLFSCGSQTGVKAVGGAVVEAAAKAVVKAAVKAVARAMVESSGGERSGQKQRKEQWPKL